MEQYRIFHYVIFLLRPEAILYPTLDHNNFSLGILDPKLKLLQKEREIMERFIQIPVSHEFASYQICVLLHSDID